MAKSPNLPGAHRPGAPAPSEKIAAFLAEATARPPRAPAQRGRLIFALDATASRQPTWDLACQSQAAMFAAASRVGGLEVRLAYFRGHGEARASRWVGDAAALRGLMTGIACHGGLTQIGRVLDDAARAAAEAPVAALVYVGDAMEEDLDALCHKAGALALRGTRAFMFLEGRDPAAERAFREIARLTRGVFLPFDARAGDELAGLLGAIATYAAGGRAALASASGSAARRLLADLRP
ncbi:MAG: VWA domain-containing protein [Amaricoccus sp.]|uniref:VWA domain-containing protein n=1 Tax=Amaricoccus sp. TaxID=1872485 RepID=UPI0033163909